MFYLNSCYIFRIPGDGGRDWGGLWGAGRGERVRQDRALGGRLLHLHQQRQPAQLLRGRRDRHRLPPRQVIVWDAAWFIIRILIVLFRILLIKPVLWWIRFQIPPFPIWEHNSRILIQSGSKFRIWIGSTVENKQIKIFNSQQLSKPLKMFYVQRISVCECYEIVLWIGRELYNLFIC